MAKTLVLGASPNPSRFSYLAVKRLLAAGEETIALGIRDGNIDGVDIQKGKPMLKEIDTITLYLGPDRQPEYYDYILNLHPRRIIFNPGTENPELAKLARDQGIITEIACTLVMLASGMY
ncbi:MAG: CoA-binding protein [Saprospiraceae bacterium]|nr:MAG: CoA-binding protein [Saprospiraceae bacterium]